MAFSQTLRAPSGITGTVLGLSGTSYTIDANGFVAITVQGDTGPLLANGFTIASVQIPSQAIGANNTPGVKFPLLGFKNADGTTLAAAAAAGKFGLSLTPGTSEQLASEAAVSNTKTDTCVFEELLPASYVAASALTYTLTGLLVGAGTLTTKTVGLEIWKVSADGTMGANLVSTAAQVLTTASADYAFAVTGTTLSPGDRLVGRITVTLVETGAVSTVANVTSVRRS